MPWLQDVTITQSVLMTLNIGLTVSASDPAAAPALNALCSDLHASSPAAFANLLGLTADKVRMCEGSMKYHQLFMAS